MEVVEAGVGLVERSGTEECEKVQRIQTDAWGVVAAVVVGEVVEEEGGEASDWQESSEDNPDTNGASNVE